jgi:hypothetical protein
MSGLIGLLKGWPGKPSHPPLTDASIGAYTVGTLMLLLGALGVEEEQMAHGVLLAISGGLLLAVPTALTGLLDWLDLPKGTPLKTVATVHLATMVAATVAFGATGAAAGAAIAAPLRRRSGKDGPAPDANGAWRRSEPHLAPAGRKTSAAQRILVEGLLIACALSAGVHIVLAPEHLSKSVLLGLSFIAAAVLLLALGLGVYMHPQSGLLALAIALLSSALIAAYAASRTVGLPVLHPAPEALDAIGVITKAVEAIALALSVRLLLEPAAGSRRCDERRRTRWTTISSTRGAGS